VPCGASPPRPRVRVGSIADPAPRSFTFRTDFEGTGSPVVPHFGGGHGGSPLGVPAPSLKRAGGGDRLRPPDWACGARLRPDDTRETDGGMPAVRAMRDSPRRARSRSTTFGRWAPPIRGRERMTKDLEGEQSPWEERATRRWQRRWVATDSSTEQCPEVGCSAGAAPKADAGNGIHPWSHPSSAKRLRRGPRVRLGSLGPRRPLVGPGSLRRFVFQHGMAPSGTPRARKSQDLGSPAILVPGAAAPATSVTCAASRAMTWGFASANRSVIARERRISAPDHTGATPASADVSKSSGNGTRARAAVMRHGC
jgi:hypothetical protein